MGSPPPVTAIRASPQREVNWVRVIVDFNMCDSNAFCMAAAPEVFEVREDDILYVLDENPHEVLREKVLTAMRNCPKNAITVEG
jgi:ferredoxin